MKSTYRLGVSAVVGGLPFWWTTGDRTLMLVGNRYIDVSEHESDGGVVVTVTLDNRRSATRSPWT